MSLAGIIIFRIILYFLDGISWSFGLMELITRYFGFVPKNRKKSAVHFCIVSAVYMILNVFLYLHSKATGGQFETINGVIGLYCVLYWMFQLSNIKKPKAFLTGIFALQIYMVISGIIGSICSKTDMSLNAELAVTAMTPVIALVFVTVLSEMSSFKRKEPMGFPLILTSFVAFILVTAFRMDDFTENVKPVIQLKVEFSEDSGFQEFSAETLIVSSAVAFIVMLIVMFLIIKESEAEYFRKKNTISEYYLEVQKEHYESLSESNREIRKIKHDMKNHIYVMRELYRSGSLDELENYMTEISDKLELADTSIHTGNEIADAIISEKSRKAEEYGIRFTADGILPDLEMSATDICTVFSNTLDNALEAVRRLPEDKRRIELDIRRSGNFLYISERNMTDGKVRIQDNSIVTSKTDNVNHGFGIINIKEAAERYGGSVNISVTDNLFHLEIMIPI